VQGFGERKRAKIEAALQMGQFTGAEDFVRRTRLGQKPLHTLAESGAFSSLGIERRDAIWALRGLVAKLDDTLALPGETAPSQEPSDGPLFAKLTRSEAILWDYRTSMHSTRGHPIECIRPQLQRRRLPTADGVASLRSGRKTGYVGMVICRQRPGSAAGVTFYTLEDETGTVNVVVWKQVFEAHAVLAKTAVLLGVSGKVQAQDGVVHLIAEQLWDPELKFESQGTAELSLTTRPHARGGDHLDARLHDRRVVLERQGLMGQPASPEAGGAFGARGHDRVESLDEHLQLRIGGREHQPHPLGLDPVLVQRHPRGQPHRPRLAMAAEPTTAAAASCPSTAQDIASTSAPDTRSASTSTRRPKSSTGTRRGRASTP